MSDPQSSPQDLAELTELARRFSEREMYEEAADLFLLALRLDPKNLGVKLGLAEVRKLQRRQKGGPPRTLKEMLREQFRRSSIDAAHFLGLAHLYAEKGENGRAIECIEVARAKDLENPAHHKLYGRILFRRQDFENAAEEFARALRLNPFDRETAESLGRAEYERKQFEPALRAAVHAFLLLNEADNEAVERVRRRIQTLKQILGWGNRELSHLFREQQEILHTAFDRLEWHRERFLEEGGMPQGTMFWSSPPTKVTGGQIELASRLRRLRVWSHLSDEQIFKLTRAVEEEIHEIGSVVFAHRSTGQDLYVLDRGEITIQRPTSYGTFALGTLEPGELFGESSYITRQERTGDAVAAQPSQVFRVDAKILAQLIEDSPDLGTQLYWSLWHALARKLRGTNEQLRGFFSADTMPENFLRLRRQPASAPGAVKVESSDKIRLFREQGLSRRELMTLATFSKEKRFAEGAFLFQEGDKGSEMYVVLEGKAMISKFIPGAGEEALAILERGDFFGEMSLIDGEPRSADAKAHSGPLTVLALDQSTVKEVLAMDPHASLEFLQLLCRLVANRLREIDEKVVGWRILSGERTESSASA
ncbi:MAG TPA: cyclic nucleotide-binding domain-containing protein [Thermoanaerobaculia bacterium]|nr:cyclic nucleotide-binding domain-containing protein [Thermoanaerobaculia bacterium]